MPQLPSPPHAPQPIPHRRLRSDLPFLLSLAVIGGLYVVLILAMLLADVSFTSPHHLLSAFASQEIRYAIKLSLLSCTITTILSLWVAVPLGYLMSRFRVAPPTRGPQKDSVLNARRTLLRIAAGLLDSILDIPIVLPPLVIGLSLLILFQVHINGKSIEKILYDNIHIAGWHMSVTYAIPSVILAQFSVACAFAVRTMRVTFDQISPRSEQVALTLGCTRAQAFWLVVVPEARRGILTAATLSWARALGEFGPILVFSGATRLKTEVLPTTVFLELSVGNIEAAVAVSLLMVAAAVIVLLIVRLFGSEAPLGRGI